MKQKQYSLLKSVSLLTLIASLSGCASLGGVWTDLTQDLKSGSVTTPAEMSRAVYVFDEPTQVLEIVETATIPNLVMPGQMKARPASIELFDQVYRSPFQAVSYANRNAAVEPDSSNYLNAIQIYPYTPGSLYQVYSAPQQVTDIALEEEGEEPFAYIRVLLDGPEMDKPINAALFDREGGTDLVWSRPKH